jgi:plasmid maintenance system antidote protein VapI
MLQVVSTISHYRQATVWNRSDLHLCRFFGLSEGFWLWMQSSHDLRWAYGSWANRAPHGPEWEISAERIALAP